jgi:hypothetical protein
MEEEDDRMWARPLGDVGEGVEHRSVAGDLEGLHCCGIGGIGSRVRVDGGGQLLGRQKERGAQERGGGKQTMEAHGSLLFARMRVVKARFLEKKHQAA